MKSFEIIKNRHVFRPFVISLFLVSLLLALSPQGRGQVVGATLTGAVVINQGDVSVENNNGVGQNNSITVADGAALVLS